MDGGWGRLAGKFVWFVQKMAQANFDV